uniref:Uncharacterized protein n=1 Tax=Phlebotomus papatasi TaxID=29031 RepID=A0A1B0D6C1_PHLPP
MIASFKHIFTLVDIVLVVISVVSGQVNSPCPNLFQYQHNGYEAEGALEVPGPPLGGKLELHIFLTVPVQLPSNLMKHIDSRSLRIVDPFYPPYQEPQTPPPPPPSRPTNPRPSNPFFSPGINPQITSNRNQENTVQVCGKIESRFSITPLIFGGEEFPKGSWPWLVAVHVYKGAQFSFVCGGTLVSQDVIVSAAHCFTDGRGGGYQAADVIVFVGKHDLRKLKEDGELNLHNLSFRNCITGRLLSYVGTLELRDSQEATLQRLQSGQTVRYRVKFPLPNPVPRLVKITYNGNVICQGEQAKFPSRGSYLTNIRLHHVLTTRLSNSPFQDVDEYPNSAPFLPQNNYYGNNSTNPFFDQSNNYNPYGGSNNFIPQAPTHAPAFPSYQEPQTPTKIIFSTGATISEVNSLNIHPEFLKDPRGSFDADIAVLILRESVEYSAYIRPVCLWSLPTDEEYFVGKTGVVVGWGRDEKGNLVTYLPKRTQVPLVSTQECINSREDFSTLTSSRTLCGGWRDGVNGPCTGDSGGGLIMYENGRWQLRGIISIAIKHPVSGVCDLREYVVFTDAAKFTNWIRSFMTR